MKKQIIAAVLIGIAGKAYAVDFSRLQALNAGDLRAAESVSIPMPAAEIKNTADLRAAALKISGYAEKEFAGKFLNAKELEDLTKQLNYFTGLAAKEIPAELLGYLEGISISIQDMLPKGPVGRNIGPALKAARALQSKVTSMKLQDKALRGGLSFAVGNTSIKIEPANFIPASVSANLACRLEDGSGSVGSRPEQELAVKVFPAGKTYQIEISAGKLSQFSLFSSPKSCQYVLNIRSASGVAGSLALAGSSFNMTKEELSVLLSDPKLNEKISARNQPLKLAERNGYIVAVN